jgi:hypothetical protein
MGRGQRLYNRAEILRSKKGDANVDALEIHSHVPGVATGCRYEPRQGERDRDRDTKGREVLAAFRGGRPHQTFKKITAKSPIFRGAGIGEIIMPENIPKREITWMPPKR